MKHIIYILVAVFFVACYDDKGNYNYSDINEILVGLDEVYSVRVESDTVIKINPNLSQSLQKNKENLKFLWLHSTTGSNFYSSGGNSTLSGVDTVCETEELQFHIDPDDKNLKYEHYFRFTVYDASTDVTYQFNTKMKLGKPFDGSWMVLHAKDGQTELGSVEYIGDAMLMTRDVYHKETGLQFRGKPLCLGRAKLKCSYYGSAATNMFSVITDDRYEAGVYNLLQKFEKKDSLIRMVYDNAQLNFDFEKVERIDGEGTRASLLLSNGRFYQIPSAMKIYEPKVDDKFTGDVYFSHAVKIGQLALVYDKAGHRFGHWVNLSSSGNANPEIWGGNDNPDGNKVSPIPVRAENSTDADPNNVDPNQQVLFVGPGYLYNSSNSIYMNAYALSVDGQGGCFVYVFDAYGIAYLKKGVASFSGYYRLNMPDGLDENSCLASTSAYSGILFYSSGSTIYRLDFQQTGGKATPIYTHPGSKGIRRMEFARTLAEKEADLSIGYKNYGYELARSLGVAFEMEDGTYDFVVLNLSANGYVASDSGAFPAKQVHEGFGEIADFVFI